ncbi:MAG: DUF429 domain-containing protein [Candidatus Aquicultorales bacterium]
MNYVGIDLAWSEKGTTGLAVLDDEGRLSASALGGGLDEIVRFVWERAEADCLVGIDAPLIVKNAESCRGCERELLRRKISLYPSNRTWMTRHYGEVRGERLVEALEVRGFSITADHPSNHDGGCFVYEVYPRAVLVNHFYDTETDTAKTPRYKTGRVQSMRSGVREVRDVLGGLELPVVFDDRSFVYPVDDAAISRYTRGELKVVGDLLDAALSAYMVYWARHFGNMAGEIVGDLEEGYILVPPTARV